jgi:hypothetical protein
MSQESRGICLGSLLFALNHSIIYLRILLWRRKHVKVLAWLRTEFENQMPVQ